MDIKELEKKNVDELARIGGDLDVADADGMGKDELVEQIMQRQTERSGQSTRPASWTSSRTATASCAGAA